MASPSPAPRRRGRPPGTTNAVRAARAAAAAAAAAAAEQPSRKRRYIPGGPGGGGRYIEADEAGTPTSVATTTTSRTRGARDISYALSPATMPRRERSARTRATAGDDFEEIQWGSAAAVAASVKQAEDYKPREERSWEEFHPNLDIERTFVVFTADEVDGVSSETPATPSRQTPATPFAGSMTPARNIEAASTGNTPSAQTAQTDNPFDSQSLTPSRRPRRQARDSVSFFTTRTVPVNGTPRTPRILPISNQTPKERLDLKLPSFRKTNRIELFESKTFGQARYVDKAMSNVGYQESDNFEREESTMLRAMDGNAEDDAEQQPDSNPDDHTHHARLGRVEYDMDEQDDMWLQHYNVQRKQGELEPITREVFEITMTKIEKEWHALERRIPKPNPKPPQTHRPRSSSAAAVNGETHGGDEPDSKCAICDDGDCENTNAIVFCDGCNLAVHQECYGVPFIPEGQWLCRKCQLCGRGVPTCIFCPNTDGAFKQTNSSKWAHLLCAMWIPEVSLGNHTFMEPVMDVEKVPKTRWKLSCYICRQRMGACIQCSNKSCYQAFHVTCARKARLYLKMKTSHGALAVLDGSMILKAFCDKHCPPDYTVEHNVHQATRLAKKFYKRNMRGRIWADNQAVANVLAAQHRIAITEHPPDECQMTGAKNSAVLGDSQNKGQPPKNLWKLPSGAPIIPHAVFEVVEASIQRFPFRKRKDFLSEACRYWTLKREARRGAALLKRLQLQMDGFTSMELTRRDFTSMGSSGKTRLARRLEFAENIVAELEQLKALADDVSKREQIRVDATELERDFVDECYFPVAQLLGPVIEKALNLDKELFEEDLKILETRVNERHYATVQPFVQDLGDAIGKGIYSPPERPDTSANGMEGVHTSPAKTNFSDIRERRKLGKRILKSVQPALEAALRIECEITNKPFEAASRELETLINASLDTTKPDADASIGKDEDTIMVDAAAADNSEITVKSLPQDDEDAPGEAMDTADDEDNGAERTIDVNTSGLGITQPAAPPGRAARSPRKNPRGAPASETPPDSDEYSSMQRAGANGGPPTPPQSNGSLGKQPVDPLTEGGIAWHLRALEPLGTSAMVEQTPGGYESRLLSEDLTDLDEVELKGLGADIDKYSAVEEGDVSPSKSRAGKAQQARRASGRRR